MSKRITELPLATQLNTEDQFIFYSNSAKETQRVNAGISLNVIASNLPGVLKATTNASLAVANAAVAQAAASAAQADATTAIGDAAGAQSSADGKNKIFYQTEPPTNPISGYALRENDLWYDINNGYKMSKWSGSVWTEYQLDDQALAGLNVGKLTAGFISSKIIELSDSTAYIQSSSYIQTWVSGMPCSVYNESLQYNGKETPSHNVRCKVKQENGTYKVFNCLNVAGSTNAPAASGNNTWWSEIAVPTVSVDVGGEATNIPNFGFRVVGQGTAEFSAATFTGNIQTNTGFFGSGKNIVRIGSNGLTIGNSGYIKSDGVTYGEISPSVIDFSGNGFFLGNTQGEGQDNAYQFYIGNRITSKYLKWDGTNLVINGRIATGSVLGDSNSGSSVNSQGGIVVGSKIGIRRNVDTDVLTITGGTDNWTNSGAGQIDLTGIGAQAPGSTLVLGVVQLIGGKSSTGKVFLRTWSGAGDGYYDCVTASTNGSVGINNSSPSSSYKLDVDGAGRFTGELISSNITASISTYTVGLWDGGNNIRFKYEDGLYAKIDASDPILIVSPKLNLSSQQILAPFSFGTAVGSAAGGIVAGTLQWDGNGTITQGSGVAMTPLGLVGGQYGSPKFTIGINGDATFAGTLSAPNGNIGGFTIDGKLYIQKTTLTDANDGVYLATDGIALGASSVFKVTSAGALTAASATITGAITATSGFIGTAANGFSINSSYIAKGKVSLTDSNSGVYIGADGIALGASSVFKVTNTGVLTATSANITGAITATSGSFTGTVTATSGSFTGTITSTLGTIGGFTIGPTSLTTGTGSSAIGMATSGGYAFFAGNATPASAPFRVAPTGELTATSVTVTGSVTSTSGNIAGTTTVGNGGTSAVTIGGAINSSGIISSAALSNKLDTAAGTILGQFALTGSGALQIGTFSSGASGDIRITPNGITARNSSGTTTFSLDGTTGNAVFAGQLSGASGTFSGNISGASGTFQGAISSNSVTATGGNIGGFTIGATSLTAGTGSSAIGMATSGGYAFFAGNATPASAPFRVAPTGELTATSVTVTGSITSNSGNIAGTTTVGNGGTTAVIIGGSINTAGVLVTDLINSKLDTSAKQIKDGFSFTSTGALNITGTGSANIKISPSGIVATNSSNNVTFTLNGTDGSATFGGNLSAPTGSIGGFTIGAAQLYTGSKSTFGSNNAGVYVGNDGIKLGSAFYVDTNGSLTASSITATGSITSTSGNIAGTTTVGNGSTTAVTVGGAINTSGVLVTDLINNRLDTSAKQIKDGFSFTPSGALDITGTGSASIKISPAGIVATNSSGATTFTLNGNNGSATFAGNLSAPSGTIGGFNIDSTRLYTSRISLDTSTNDGQLSISSGGTALMEVLNSRARFATKNNGGTYTAILQGDDGLDGGSFLELNNSSGSLRIRFAGSSGYGYFTTFYDNDDSAYYCNPASTSNFNGLNVGGNAVLTTNTSITVTEIRKTGAGEGLTVPLIAGGNSISFRFADGKLIVKIDNTDFHIPLIAGTG